MKEPVREQVPMRGTAHYALTIGDEQRRMTAYPPTMRGGSSVESRVTCCGAYDSSVCNCLGAP
jgi:hypothetical protein